MNPRIQELARQAKIEFTYDPTETPMRAFAECWEDELQRFAELIVRECVKVVDETMTESQEMNIGLVMASAQIVAHFGVEE